MKKKLNLLFIAFLFCITNISAQTTQTDIPWATLADSPWPMISHDPQFTGRSPYKGPQTANVIWTRDYPDGIFSGPVIGEEGNLYFGSYYQLDSADKFYSITPTNEDRWIFDSGSNRPPQTGIVIDSSNTIYFGSFDRYFYALYPDGTLKWKYETSAIIFEIVVPNIDLEGRLYITNGLGELYSLNPDGTLNWKVKHDGGFFLKSPVFSPDGNTIYIAGSDSGLYALNLDGTLKWKRECGKIRHLLLVDSQGNIYITPEEIPQYFYSLNPDGDVNWGKGIILTGGGSLPVYSSPTIDKDGNIYALLGDTSQIDFNHRALFSFTHEGETRWKYIFQFGEDADDFWQPLICDSEGTVYLGSTFGSYYYAISSEGELKWKLPLNEYQVDNTGAIGEDGTLYIGVHKSSLWNGNEKNLIAIRDSITTDIKGANHEIPNEYKLYQNYPNPFNPITTINYQLKESGFISLKVYDVLGKEVAKLVNERKNAGFYSISFNASKLTSGLYIYRMIVNNFAESKRMLLVK